MSVNGHPSTLIVNDSWGFGVDPLPVFSSRVSRYTSDQWDPDGKGGWVHRHRCSQMDNGESCPHVVGRPKS